MSNRNNIFNVVSHFQNIKLSMVFESVLIGLITGGLVVSYRLILKYLFHFSEKAYTYLSHHLLLIPFWVILLVLVALWIRFWCKKDPMVSGSGIPQVEGELLGYIEMNWWKTLINKFINGVLAIGSGLSLGREGPSVQMGALVGKGVSRLFKKLKFEEKYLMSSGAGAGLSGAFSAPFAGIIFVLEEVHKNFSPRVLLPAAIACITADFFNKFVFGFDPVFNFSKLQILPLNHYFLIIVLGILIAFAGNIFNHTLLKSLKIFENQKVIHDNAIIIVPVLIAIILGFVLPQVIGGGHELVESLILNQTNFKLLIILLFAKFLFTMISYGSGAPGGIFLPLLVIGAIMGNIFGQASVFLFNIDPVYVNNFIILAMAGYFTAIVRAPITGSILITEMTGSFSHLLSLSLVSFTCFLVTDLLKGESIYESLLARFIKKNKNIILEEHQEKVIIEIVIHTNSFLDNKKIMDINWPPTCLLIGIKRGKTEIIPKGLTQLMHGDLLIILTNKSNETTLRKGISFLAENQ